MRQLQYYIIRLLRAIFLFFVVATISYLRGPTTANGKEECSRLFVCLSVNMITYTLKVVD